MKQEDSRNNNKLEMTEEEHLIAKKGWWMVKRDIFMMKFEPNYLVKHLDDKKYRKSSTSITMNDYNDRRLQQNEGDEGLNNSGQEYKSN